ncbi:hypothetical protein PHSC3_001139 [Chlamydiales bacterium STE3]|nr:hypothetical protein PHSC3_001139 [Chlamydiales bacterium STE3]
MPFKLALLSLLFFSILTADPWGKDADMLSKPPQNTFVQAKSGFGVSLSRMVIRFHQEVISPADGPRSHYIPSSSQYTLDAINKYGFMKGWIYGCDRLLRENSDKWVYREVMAPDGCLMKWNPVP